MKQFFKMLLAVICGIIITTVCFFVFLTGAMAGMSMDSSKAETLPAEGVLKIDLSRLTLAEQSKPQDYTAMLSGMSKGTSRQTIGIRKAVVALQQAAKDPGVKYIYLKTDSPSAGFGQLEEFRKALVDFRSSGKPIVAYTQNPTTASYYLASAADKIYMSSVEGGMSMFLGVGGSMTFLKDLLDKLGINVQLIRHGKYKSAGEMYVKNSPSPENLEQNQEMVSSIWEHISTAIASSRDITIDEINAAVDELKLNFPEDFVEQKLVDELYTAEQLKAKLASLAVKDSFKDVKFLPFCAYADSKVKDNFKAKQKIAIIYANGEIIDGVSEEQIAGDRFAAIADKVRADSTIKAVVLRVNSPGGSVVGSDKFKKALDTLGKVKPLIASYANYAASGGYWISNNCAKIFSDATTLTGSIGVFSMIPDFSKTLSDIAHVNITAVNSNKHTDMLSAMRPLDADELAYMQSSVERIYTAFVSIVAEGRGLEPDYVDSIAQGRVWTGAQALSIGLVDEIGTLQDAIHYAASLADPFSDDDLDAWNITEYPRVKTPMELIMDQFNPAQQEVKVFENTPFEDFSKAVFSWKSNIESGKAEYMFARMPYCWEIR